MMSRVTTTTKRCLATLSLVLLSAALLSSCSAKSSPRVVSTHLLQEQYGVLDDPLTKRYLEGIVVRLSSAVVSRQRRGSTNSDLPSITLLASLKPVALAPNPGVILISQGMLRVVANEAELAFVLAHEMAHQQLDHTDLQVDKLSSSARKELELAADQRAIAVMAAAGYDPRAAFSALQRTDLQSRAREPSSHALTTSNYPDLDERQNAALTFLNNSGWLPPGTINRRDFVMIQRRLLSR